MRSYLILTATLISAHVFADCGDTPTPNAPVAPTIPQNPFPRLGVAKNSNFFIGAEAVFFRPVQKVKNSNLYSYPGGDAPYTASYFSHKFQPGVRAYFGFNMPYDGWDSALIYTGFSYKHNNKYNSLNNDGSGITLNFPGTISLKYDYNQADIDLGRMIQTTKKIRFRPHFGVRNLWLTQQKIYNTESTIATYHTKSKYKNYLVGLEAGIDSLWQLANEWSFYANFGYASLLNAQKNFSFATENNQYLLSDSYNYGYQIISDIDFSLGFRWDRMFSDNRYHFGASLGYEMHNYININQDASPSLADFTLMGVSLGARFDF